MNSLSQIYGIRAVGSEQIRYVGLTTKGADVRFHAHKTKAMNGTYNWPVHRWIRKIGPENVEVVVLEYCDPNELAERETYWIDRLQTFHSDSPYGLNLTRGGDGTVGCSAGAEHYERLRTLYKGRYFSEETRKKISEAAKGRVVSEEARAKISAAQTGRVHSEESRAKRGPKIAETKHQKHIDSGIKSLRCSGCEFTEEERKEAVYLQSHIKRHVKTGNPSKRCTLCATND